MKSIEKRFDESYIINLETKCWEWQRSLGSGYGVFYLGSKKGQSKTARAHRYSYERFVEKIPIDLFVLHKCDNRKCVNPEHLFLGSIKDNYNDMIKKGRGPNTRSLKNKHGWKP